MNSARWNKSHGGLLLAWLGCEAMNCVLVTFRSSLRSLAVHFVPSFAVYLDRIHRSAQGVDCARNALPQSVIRAVHHTQVVAAVKKPIRTIEHDEAKETMRVYAEMEQ